MKFIFAGTPDFAARVLTHLVEIGRRPCLVVSQPDRPKGRGRKSCAPETVEAAARLGIPSIQVDDINAPGSVAQMAESGAQTLVVTAFGQILRQQVLDRFLCLNVHGSLLPKYRGAAPIERAIAAGEACTGVSIMRMSPGLDEGPWTAQFSVSMGIRGDAGSVARELAILGAEGIDQALTALLDDNISWNEQTGASTYASKLGPADTILNVGVSSLQAHHQVRSLSPDIGAHAKSGALDIKIWRTWPYGSSGLDPVPDVASGASGRPGSVVVGPGRLFIGCAEGVVEILLIQPAGRGRMAAAEFLRGYAARLGATLDTGIASIQSGGDAEATDKIASAGGTDPSCDAPVFT